MSALLKRIEEIAETTGKSVVIGRQGHKDEWFAHCDGIEWAGSTPRQALESVALDLKRRAEKQAFEAARTAQASERLSAL